MSDAADIEWFLKEVNREQSRLRAFVRSLGVRSEAVDDLAQDVLVIAFEKRATFDRSADFGFWVRGIARKLVANSVRKETRRQRFLSDPITEILLQAKSSGLHPLADSSKMERDDSLAALGTCLAGLPEKSKQLIHLRYFDQCSPGIIAGQLNRTSNEIRQALFRVRQALLKCIVERTNHAAQ